MASTINSSTSNGIVITPDTSGEIELQANGVTKAKVTANGLQDANGNSITGGMYRNLIINGDMKIAQRGTSFTGISQGSNEGYTLDRWRFQIFSTSAHGTYTVSQDTDVPSGQGFANSIKVSCTTADTSLAADPSVIIDTRLEGQNLQHLKKGTSAAEKLTISFWVKSNLTGNAVLYLYDHDNNREVASLVNISTANTWEKKTLTFDGDTTGAFDNDNANSLTVRLYMASGSDNTSGTLPTSWQNYNAGDTAAGISIDIGSSTSNYINITGVQLEVGSGASDFEFLPYDVQLQRCQRYYYRIDATVAGSYPSPSAYAISTTQAFVMFPFPVVMRATPTSFEQTGTASDYRIVRCGLGTYADCSLVPTITTSMPHMGMAVWKVASGLSNGTAGSGNFATTSAYVGWSAEL